MLLFARPRPGPTRAPVLVHPGGGLDAGREPRPRGPSGSCAEETGLRVDAGRARAVRSGTRSSTSRTTAVWYRQEQDVLPGPGRPRGRSTDGGFDAERATRPSTTTVGGRWPSSTETTTEDDLPARLPRCCADPERRDAAVAAHRGAPRGRSVRPGAGPAAARASIGVAGADEAGRGACAGPLVVGRRRSCRPARRGEIAGLADSKLLTAAARERVLRRGRRRAPWRTSVVVIPADEVDRRGLHVCNLAGMRRALAALAPAPRLRAHRRLPGRRPRRARARGVEGRPGGGLRRGRQSCWPRSPGTGSWSSWTASSRSTASPSTRATATDEHYGGAAPSTARARSTGSRT